MSSRNESGSRVRVYKLLKSTTRARARAEKIVLKKVNFRPPAPPPISPSPVKSLVPCVVSHLHRSYVNSIYFTEHTLRHTLTLFTSIYFTSCGTTSWRSEECGYSEE